MVALVMGAIGLAIAVRMPSALKPGPDARLVIGSIWIVGGLLMAASVSIAHYLVLLLDEVRRRPTIVRREYTRE